MKILPSLFNANPYDYKSDLDELKKAGIEWLHVDITDGHFVPEITFGEGLTRAVKNNSDFKLDCHLLIQTPEKAHIFQFLIDEKVERIVVHAEATQHLDYCIEKIHAGGIQAGVAINPSTSVSAIKEILPFVDEVLVMTCNPGRSDATFLPHTLNKVRELDTIRKNEGYNYRIEVDGKVSNVTIEECVKAGVDDFVSGGYIFGGNSITENVESLEKFLKVSN